MKLILKYYIEDTVIPINGPYCGFTCTVESITINKSGIFYSLSCLQNNALCDYEGKDLINVKE